MMVRTLIILALVCLPVQGSVQGPVQGQEAAGLSDAAQQAAQSNRPAEAEQLWRQAIEISPRFFPALFNLGYFHYSRRDYLKAIPYLERAGRVLATDFNTHYLLGACYQAVERREEALIAWRTAIGINPRSSRLLQIMVVEYGKGRYFQEAAELVTRALELAPGDLNSYLLAIKAHQDAGLYDVTIEIARKAVTGFPRSARARFEYGFHLQKVGRTEAAIAELREAIRLDPAYEEPFYFLGEILQQLGQYEEAILNLRKAISIRADYTPARVALAKSLIGLKRLEEAVAVLNESIGVDPRHPQPHLMLSQVYFRLGREEDARREKELSLRLRRENPTVLEAVQGRQFPEPTRK